MRPPTPQQTRERPVGRHDGAIDGSGEEQGDGRRSHSFGPGDAVVIRMTVSLALLQVAVETVQQQRRVPDAVSGTVLVGLGLRVASGR
jgi:hypothetical protein